MKIILWLLEVCGIIILMKLMILIDGNASQGKSFSYKTKVVKKTPAQSLQPRNPRDAD